MHASRHGKRRGNFHSGEAMRVQEEQEGTASRVGAVLQSLPGKSVSNPNFQFVRLSYSAPYLDLGPKNETTLLVPARKQAKSLLAPPRVLPRHTA